LACGTTTQGSIFFIYFPLKKKKPKKPTNGMPEHLKKWRKKERKRYVNMMAKNNELEVYFYVVKLFNDNERFIKIGISIDIEQRFKDCPYNYKILRKGVFDLNKAWNIETMALNNLYRKKVKYNPKIDIPGKTECFKTASLLVIKKLLAQNSIY
jgi:hypothetical protein